MQFFAFHNLVTFYSVPLFCNDHNTANFLQWYSLYIRFLVLICNPSFTAIWQSRKLFADSYKYKKSCLTSSYQIMMWLSESNLNFLIHNMLAMISKTFVEQVQSQIFKCSKNYFPEIISIASFETFNLIHNILTSSKTLFFQNCNITV